MSKNSPQIEIIGIGAPFVDQIIEVNEEYLERIVGSKGGMQSVDYQTLQRIIKETQNPPVMVFGGSAANTTKGLANFGHYCALLGKIGTDPAGKRFLTSMQELKVASLLKETATPTAQAVCLITPDGERTMRSFFGASQEFTQQDLDAELFKGVQLVHIEGYRLFNPGVVKKAMELAKEAGAQVSFDLGSFELVEMFKDTIIELVSKYVDILFGNREEIMSLTKLDPKRGCEVLKDLCGTIVVLMGREGCYVGQGTRLIQCPAYPKEPLDTTGAGDLFASGFLHGYLRNKPLEKCAHFGALAGAAVVQVLGVNISVETWDLLRMESQKPSEDEQKDKDRKDKDQKDKDDKDLNDLNDKGPKGQGPKGQ